MYFLANQRHFDHFRQCIRPSTDILVPSWSPSIGGFMWLTSEDENDMTCLSACIMKCFSFVYIGCSVHIYEWYNLYQLRNNKFRHWKLKKKNLHGLQKDAFLCYSWQFCCGGHCLKICCNDCWPANAWYRSWVNVLHYPCCLSSVVVVVVLVFNLW